MNTRRTFLPDPAGLWGIVVFITLTLFGGNKALQDGDTLWHIKMGQVMLERQELLTQDLFSHTAYGQPWHAHEWLSEIIMAALYGWAGLAGMTILYFALVGLTITVIFKVARRYSGDWAVSFAIALALPCLYLHLLARPHVFTWLGAALTLYLLERSDRWAWLLIPIVALWANLHAGVLYALVLQAIYIAGNSLDHLHTENSNDLKKCWEENKMPLVLLLSCMAAACLTPFGYQVFTFPFKVAAPIFTQTISEWKSPDFQELWFFKPWVIGILFIAMWLGKKLSWRWNLLLLFLFWQMLSHVRNLSMAALLLIPCFALLFAEIKPCTRFRRKADKDRVELVLSPISGPLLILLLTVGLIGAIWADLPVIRERMQEKFLPAKKNFPTVVEFLKAGYPEGNLLNDYEWGDYLLFGLDPPPKVFIDGRADMYGEEVFSDYKKISNLDKDINTLLGKYEIKWTIFPSEHILNRYLKDCRGWKSLYSDEFTEILIINDDHIFLSKK